MDFLFIFLDFSLFFNFYINFLRQLENHFVVKLGSIYTNYLNFIKHYLI